MGKESRRVEFEKELQDSSANTQRLRIARSASKDQSNDYGDLVEKATVSLYVIQGDRLCYVSSSLASLLGYESPEELIGKSLWELIHPDDQYLFKLGTQGVKTNIFAAKHTLRVFKKDGAIIWVQTDGNITFYQRKPAIVGHLIDVTHLKNAEKSMQESLDKYQAVINEIEEGVGETDLRGNLLFINDAGCRTLGNKSEEIVGSNYKSYIDEEGAKFIRAAYNKVYKTGLPNRFIHEIIRKDGVRRIVEDSVSPIRDADGNISGFRAVQRDVTDRVEAEKRLASHRTRLEAIFASVNEGIVMVDPDLRIIEANRSTEDICGIAAQEAAGQVFAQCVGQCSKSCSEVLKQTLEKKSIIKEYLIECSRHNRHQQIVSVTSSPLVDPAGNFMGAVLVIRDITLLRDLERELRERNQFQNIVGRSKRMQDIYRLLEDLANLETTVLITGESGTGKELVARALHYSGQRAFQPFVTVNCSALAESLLESELFGHVKGAFTGAIKDKEGRFQAANGGTILLDEIGDISSFIQLKLLRVLQEKVFERVGESIPQKVDVRVLACTNKDLKEKVRRGEFRQDLYYRLKVVEVSLPPLRDRLEDLPLLVDHFCQSFRERFKKNIDGISSEVLSAFMNYPWPGNIRELEHVLEHAFVLCHGRIITLGHLPTEIRDYERIDKTHIPKMLGKEPRQAEEILDALNKARWNKTKAARMLGISRRTVHRKIHLYQLIEE